MTEGVSVIVCCYNSAQRLPQTIECLVRQIVPAQIPWEIIIIDNASLDDTAAVAKTEWEKYSVTRVPFRLLYQPLQGLSHARTMGIYEAKHDILVFCDDDNLLCDTYVQLAKNAIEADSKIGAVGGHGKSFFAMPNWLSDFAEFYAIGPQGNPGDVTTSRGCLYGAGLVIRKSAYQQLKKLQFESLASDRKGNALSSGGDTELTFALRIAGYRLFYDERLRFTHVIPKTRFSFSYFLRLIFNIGYSWASLTPYHAYIHKFKIHYPTPSKGDLFYSFKALLRSFFDLMIKALQFKLAPLRKAFVATVFKLGEFVFMVRRYGDYQSRPKFLNGNP